MIILLSIFWFIRQSKVALFYLYLWQIKEYQVRRFIDHFRTYKGKRLILNKANLLKIGLCLIFILFFVNRSQLEREFLEGFFSLFWKAVILLYFIEILFIFKNLFQKKIKKPVLTIKTAFLIGAALLVEILILFVLCQAVGIENIALFAFWLLIFDILALVIFSIIVLCFQVPTVLLRNLLIIKKAKRKREEYKDLLVVGITGSYGKTSTKEFLAEILSERFKVLKTREHQNSEVGISQCILKDLEKEHQVFVVEMGAYGKGGIKLLSNIACPKIGVLTGINEQHMTLFGSQAKIIKTKYELIESLPKHGLAVFNGDNKYCLDLYNMTNIPKKLYLTEKPVAEAMLKPDIFAENIKVEKEFVSFVADGVEFKVNVLGRQNISNILAAIVVAKELGMSLEEISKACLKIKPGQGAMKLLKGKDGLNILDSSYSANPDGVIFDLDYLKIYSGKKVIIMPCLIELGKTAKKMHKSIGRKIGEICDLAIITTKDHFDEIKEGAVESGMKKENIVFAEEPKEVLRRIDIFCVSGDVVLLEGRVPKGMIELLVE